MVQIQMSRKIGSTVFKIIKYFLAIIIAIIMGFPFFWMISTSFKSSPEAIAFPPTIIPKNPVGVINYIRVLSDVPFFLFYGNSIIVAVAVTSACLLTSSLTGYIFAKFNFPGRNVLFTLILATMMIPFFVILIPIFIMVVSLGLVDTLWALIIPGLVSAFGIFLMRQYMASIPGELIDAARIDGCSEFGIYSRVILPLSKPALSALGIFIFTANWDSFLWPLIVIEDINKRTVPVGLALFTQQFGIPSYNLILAASVLAVLPVLIVFLLFQKNFIQGITLTGIKA